MDADSSYGGSDTAQDSTCGNESSSLENTTIISQSDTSQNDISQNSNNLVSTISVNTEENPYYNKNEITLPVNRDETDFKSENSSTKLPHYLTTANLNINETLEHHSNLEAMSKQYRSTSYLNAESESPPSQRKSGLDNPGFDDDEEVKEKQRIKSSFDQNKPYNGDLNLSVNSPIQNDEPLTEAVNLELINLKPSGKDVTGLYENGKNGMTSIPMKPDVDAEMGNPYDEYFVPVNEHKKYMRGEKLYVTMDKRNVKKKSRCLCWGVCISIVLAAIIVGILASVGVIGAKPVQEVSSRQFSGSTPEVKTGGIFGLPPNLDTSDDIPPKYTPGPSSSTVPYPLTTDMSEISVPQALESQIKIDNLEFDPEYANKSSKKFQDLASTIESELKEAIFTDDELIYGPADIEVKVIDFTEGSVIARYRITWKFKDGLHDTKDPIDANLLDEKIVEKIRENHNYLSAFLINEEATMNKTMRVLDSCKIQNFGCEYECLFDYSSAEFICICPEGKLLNEDGKHCDKSPLLESSNEEKSKRPLESIPEPTSEPEPHSEPEIIHKMHSDTTPEPQPEFFPIPYTEPGPHDNLKVEESSTEPATGPHAEPTSEPQTEPHAEPAAEPTSEPHAEPTSEPHAEPTSEPHVIPTSEPHAEPTSEPHAEPTSEPHVEPTSEPHAEPTSEPQAKPTPEPTSDSQTEPISERHAEPSSKSTEEPQAEPTTAPKLDPNEETYVQSNLGFRGEPHAEPTAEPQAEPTAEPHAEPTAEPHAEPTAEPQAEPTAEPQAEPTVEPQSKADSEHPVQLITEPHAEMTTDRETITEPFAEITVEPEIIQIPDQFMKQTTEPQAEPTSTPLAEPTPEPNVHSLPESNLKSAAEPSSTPHSPSEDEMLQTTSKPRSEFGTEISFENEFMTFKPPPETQTTLINVKQSLEPVTKSSDNSAKTELISNHSTEESRTEADYTTKSETISKIVTSKQTESVFEPESTTESLTESISQEKQSPETSSKSTDMHQNQTTSLPETAEILPAFNTDMPIAEAGRSMNNIFTTDMNISSEEHNQQSSNEISTRPTILLDLVENAEKNETIPITQITSVISPSTTISSQTMELENATTIENDNSEKIISSVNSNSSDTSQEGSITINPQLFGQNFTEEISTEGLSENIDLFNKTMEGAKLEKIIEQSDEAKDTQMIPEVTDQLTTSRHVEELTESTNNRIAETHQDLLMNEPNEYSNNLEIMSPFLPEIENDTFVNSLRSDDHFVDHIMNSNLDSNEEYILTTNPPRLDNDQLNKTNPLDPNPTGAISIDQENFITEQVTTQSSATSKEPNNINMGGSFRMGKKEDNPTENATFLVPSNESENKRNEDISSTTKPIAQEILNNEHSNSFFDKMDQLVETTQKSNNLDKTTYEITTMEGTVTDTTYSELNSKLAEVTDEFTMSSAETNKIKDLPSDNKDPDDISTSTEDLIAMETTTYGMKVSPSNKLNKKKSKSIDYLNEKNDLKNNFASTENNQQEKSKPNSEFDKSYAVEETVVDSTTTTKLFVTRPTTIDPLLFESKQEESQELNNNYSETTNSLNDIFNEDLSNKSEKIQETTPDEMEITTQILTENKTQMVSQDNENNQNNRKYFGKELKMDEPLRTTLNEIVTKSENDVKPVTEGFTIMGFTRCESDQFQCVNGTSVSDGRYCIPIIDRCDSVADCSDGSDEINCQKEGCPNNFQCASGQCLKRHLVCDGIVNCDDSSDEVNCESWNCTSNEFSCANNNRCIPAAWKCDGRSHCRDSSDEKNCNEHECPVNHFRCSEGGTCISNAWRCDGKTDCSNGEDEMECGCSNIEFKCKIGGGCIKLNQVCDGVSDCGDKSDEWQCLTLRQSTSILEAHMKNETSFICSTNWNATYSDIACESMGYESSTQYEEIATPSNSTKLLKIKDDAIYGSTILMNLEEVSSCEKIVTVRCQKNVCGIKSDAVPLTEDNIDNETYNIPSLSLLYNKKQNAYCSGSLIAESWVISAYSCILRSLNGLDMSPSDWVIKIGEQQRMVMDFIEHPKVKYSNFYYNNDVVLIKLDRPVISTTNVSALCIPENIVNNTQRCAIAGWKNIIPGDGTKKQYLHHLKMPLISIQECNSTKHYNGMMSQGEICVESKEPDNFPCYNDMGAPLICLSEKTKMWELQGILSHSNKCGTTRHPLVYTSMSKNLITWIENTIGQAVSPTSL